MSADDRRIEGFFETFLDGDVSAYLTPISSSAPTTLTYTTRLRGWRKWLAIVRRQRWQWTYTAEVIGEAEWQVSDDGQTSVSFDIGSITRDDE